MKIKNKPALKGKLTASFFNNFLYKFYIDKQVLIFNISIKYSNLILKTELKIHNTEFDNNISYSTRFYELVLYSVSSPSLFNMLLWNKIYLNNDPTIFHNLWGMYTVWIANNLRNRRSFGPEQTKVYRIVIRDDSLLQGCQLQSNDRDCETRNVSRFIVGIRFLESKAERGSLPYSIQNTFRWITFTLSRNSHNPSVYVSKVTTNQHCENVDMFLLLYYEKDNTIKKW